MADAWVLPAIPFLKNACPKRVSTAGLTSLPTVHSQYIDPIMVLVFASAVAAGSTDVVTKAASALQYQAWLERICGTRQPQYSISICKADIQEYPGLTLPPSLVVG